MRLQLEQKELDWKKIRSTVFAGVRKQVDFDTLSTIEDVRPLILDVLKEEDIVAAKSLIEKEGLDVLINNAGIGVLGALIEVSKEDMQKQLMLMFLLHY